MSALSIRVLPQAAGGKDKGDQQVTYEAMAAGSVGVVM